jgi:hypothetical protein
MKFMHSNQTFRKKFLLKTSLLLAAAMVVLTSATVLNPAPNFAGEWKLNEAKSDMGQFGRGAAKKIKVESMDAQGISYDRTTTNQAGEDVVRKEKLSFDGKEAESTYTGGFGNAKRKASAKITDDAMTIDATTNFERDGQPMEIKTKETWKLSDGGQTLTIEANSTSSFGENSMKLVYEKGK